MSELAPHQAEWLSLISYQRRIARAQVEQPTPLNAFAVSTLHDAVESLLSLAAEWLRAPVKARADFLQIFDAVDGALSPGSSIAGHRAAVAALNQARVGFKHHGNRPDEKTLARHLTNAESFMEQLCDAVFSIRLDEVSLLLFIHNERVRELLSSASRNWSGSEPHLAMQELWIAFDELIMDFERRKAWHPGKSLFSTKPSFLPSSSDLRALGKVGEKAFEWMGNLDRWVRMLAIGIDTRRYAYFDAHTPSGSKVLSGDVRFHWREEAVLNDQVFERCYRFVVDTALELSEDDFSFDAWTARQAARGEV